MEEKKTIVGKILAAILSVFKENWREFITKLWKKIPVELKTELLNIVDIVNRIKNYVDSPAVDLITYAIPGDKDDKAVAWLRQKLADITSELNLLDKPTGQYSSTDLHSIATRLTQEVTGLPFGQAAITIENAYQNS